MTVRFLLPSSRSLDLVSFAWSPLFESVLSMTAITRPKRTPMHLPWSRRCRELLPPSLLARIAELAGPFDRTIPGIFEVGLLGDSPAFTDELASFGQLDPDLLAYEVSLVVGGHGCGPIERSPALVHDAAYREEVLAVARAEGTHARLAARLFEDPAAVRDDYADMLGAYWEQAFHEEWARLLPRIEAEVTDGARALVTRGVPGLVEEILPEGHWDDEGGAIVVDKVFESTNDVADRGGLLFVPTVYGWPRVLIEDKRPWPLAVIFPLRDLRQPEVPTASDHEVADGLRALGDETRLQITRLVAEQPRSTKELSELLRLSDSSVSRHLKILEAAGVVGKRRDGYFVLYRLRPERIGQLGGALRRTLGLARGDGGQAQPLPVSVTSEANTGAR